MSENRDGLTFGEYWRNKAEDKINAFKETQRWSDRTKREFSAMLDKLKNPERELTTREIGDALEDIAKFIIEKTSFYDVYKNIRTESNEIDLVIRQSEVGKQLKSDLKLSDELLPTDEQVWLGECKNYQSKLGVTYVGKFYGLLKSSSINFGILFTKNGLTGDPRGYHDSHGLLKTFKVLEDIKNSKNFYIIAFDMGDYEKILEGESFFNLIEAKKLEVKIGANYTDFLGKNEVADEVVAAVQEARH